MNIELNIEQTVEMNEAEQSAPLDLNALELALVGGGTGSVIFG